MDKFTNKLRIAGEDYLVISEEQPAYMEELASEIDSKMQSVLKSGKLSTTQAAVLVALEYADEAKKNGSSSDNLRAQLKEYLEDAAQAKSERDFYKREVDRLNAAKQIDPKSNPTLW